MILLNSILPLIFFADILFLFPSFVTSISDFVSRIRKILSKLFAALLIWTKPFKPLAQPTDIVTDKATQMVISSKTNVSLRINTEAK